MDFSGRITSYNVCYTKLLRDLTIGDYWGVGIEHPEYMTRNGGHFDEAKGVSSVIVNNSKGEYLMRNNFV